MITRMMHTRKQFLSLAIAILTALLTEEAVCVPQGRATISHPVCVSRRSSRDFVYIDTECSIQRICPELQKTYLVSDETCVSNRDLVSECALQLLPKGTAAGTHETDIGAVIENRTLSMYTPTSTDPIATQVTYSDWNSTTQTDCSIAHLEVYRGGESSIEINHSGFTLTDNGTIQVDERLLSYDRSDYDGELYRLNISCPNGNEVTKEGCLFFKLLTSTRRIFIGKAKFNCTVPGTIAGNDTECQLPITTSRQSTTQQQTIPPNTMSFATEAAMMSTTKDYGTPKRDPLSPKVVIIIALTTIGVLTVILVFPIGVVTCYQVVQTKTSRRNAEQIYQITST